MSDASKALFELVKQSLPEVENQAPPQSGTRASMGEIIDTIKDVVQLKAATTAMDALSMNQQQAGPFAAIKEIGLDLGGVTGAALGVADAYKGLAQVQAQIATEKEQRAADTLTQATAMKDQSTAMLIQLLASQQQQAQAQMQSQMQAQMAALQAATQQPAPRLSDPISDTIQQMTAQLVAQSLQRLSAPAPAQANPMTSMVDSIAQVERLKSVLVESMGLGRAAEPIGSPATATSPEMLRIILEHEREKMRLAQDANYEDRRLQGASDFRGVLQDLIPAISKIGENLAGGRTAPPMPMQQAATFNAPPMPAQPGIPHVCYHCKQVTVLPTVTPIFNCTNCGQQNMTGLPSTQQPQPRPPAPPEDERGFVI